MTRAQDGSGYGVFGQRYTSAGIAQGAEFQVNTYTMNDQVGAVVAADGDGDFVVVWLQPRPPDSDNASRLTPSPQLFLRSCPATASVARFTASGSPR